MCPYHLVKDSLCKCYLSGSLHWSIQGSPAILNGITKEPCLLLSLVFSQKPSKISLFLNRGSSKTYLLDANLSLLRKAKNISMTTSSCPKTREGHLEPTHLVVYNTNFSCPPHVPLGRSKQLHGHAKAPLCSSHVGSEEVIAETTSFYLHCWEVGSGFHQRAKLTFSLASDGCIMNCALFGWKSWSYFSFQMSSEQRIWQVIKISVPLWKHFSRFHV